MSEPKPCANCGSAPLVPCDPKCPEPRETKRQIRRAASLWIAEKGWETWSKTEQCCNAGTSAGHSATEGAYLPSGNASKPFLAVCLDCIPYPGAPIRNHEHWATDAETSGTPKCARCFRSMRHRGGAYYRGGPFCWDCGSPPDDVRAAWMLAIRTDPNTPSPWYGDKANR